MLALLFPIDISIARVTQLSTLMRQPTAIDDRSRSQTRRAAKTNSAHDRHPPDSCLCEPPHNDHSDCHESDPCPFCSAPAARDVRRAPDARLTLRQDLRSDPPPTHPPLAVNFLWHLWLNKISLCNRAVIFLLSPAAGFLLHQRPDRFTLCISPVIFLLRPTLRTFQQPRFHQILSCQHTAIVRLNQASIFLLHQTFDETLPSTYRPIQTAVILDSVLVVSANNTRRTCL